MSIYVTKVHGKSPEPECRGAAERWYARLKAPDCTTMERAEFKLWRATPEHAAAYAATEALWQSVGKLSGRADLEELSQRVFAATQSAADAPPRNRYQSYLRHRIATGPSVAVASLIAVLGGAAFLGLGLRHTDTAALVYTTKPGERRTVELADGSQLILNYATEVDVLLGKDLRRLTLRTGEAIFKVAQDATRPFKVAVGDGEVTALGTRFEVRSDAEHVAVTLLEGRVAVDRDHEKEHVQLEPGDQVRFREATPQMSRRRIDPEVAASWSTGRLRFRSTPLPEVLDEINRYSATQIRIADPTLIGIPISGTFALGDTASVVAALEALLPIQSEVRGAEILLRHRG